jgi:phage terminase large subunit-like protein
MSYIPEYTTACLDWEDRIRTGKSIIPPPIFPEEAESAISVMKELRIVDAPNSPRMGDACAQWVFDLAGAIFGSYNVDTGERLIKEVFVLVSKKNSKSTIAGAIMLTALIRNWRQSAQFVVLSPTVEVATNSFAPARDMVSKDEELETLMQVQSHIKTITNRNSNATLKILAADTNTVGGLKAVGVLVDELHLFGKIPTSENMFREAFGGLASRPEGFIIYLTTQSDEPPSGVFKQKLQYARDVRDGKIIDKGFLPVIFEHPNDMVANGDCLKLENMWMTNPNMGYSVDQAFLEREFMKASHEGGDSFRGYMSKHGNVEIGMNLRSDRWAGADFWEIQARDEITLQYILDNSDIIDIGIDGGGLDDLLGLAVIGRHVATHKWLLWTHAWAHPSVLERRKSEASRFNDFSKDGDLTLVKKIGDDVYDVVEICVKVEESGLLDKIGVDPHGLGGILDALLDAGIAEDSIVGVSQGWKLQGAIKTAERRLAEGQMIHAKQPMMDWCVGNAKIEPRGNAVLITKQMSGFAKIDPLMATFNAVNLISLNPEPTGGNISGFLSNPIKA